MTSCALLCSSHHTVWPTSYSLASTPAESRPAERKRGGKGAMIQTRTPWVTDMKPLRRSVQVSPGPVGFQSTASLSYWLIIYTVELIWGDQNDYPTYFDQQINDPKSAESLSVPICSHLPRLNKKLDPIVHLKVLKLKLLLFFRAFSLSLPSFDIPLTRVSLTVLSFTILSPSVEAEQ